MSTSNQKGHEGGTALRRGWTTGACATAAAKAAATALLGGAFPDPVTICLPGGQEPAFALAYETRWAGFAEAGIVKDAGDDPDVTHGALIITRIKKGMPGSGVTFVAGAGVGTVTKPGLPVLVGEAAINPVPRKMIENVLTEVAAAGGQGADFIVTVSVPDGEAIAKKTWNPRLGILGGISILGTTGIVIPYSCSAWIHSIRSGVDVARAGGLTHLVGATGHTSEQAAQALLGLPQAAFIDMGDFVGGLLKYVARHRVDEITIAGGFAKLSKLAMGRLDLHSKRGQVDLSFLAGLAEAAGADKTIVAAIKEAPTAQGALAVATGAGVGLGNLVAARACQTAKGVVAKSAVKVHILVVDRQGNVVGKA
jgi:cobalt-precorrin-5B (C1)-methyltransferase